MDTKGTKKITTIRHLNKDCLEEIFQYLSPLDKIVVCYTCKRWARILMKKLDINNELKENFQSHLKNNYRFPIYIKNEIKRFREHINHFRIENLIDKGEMRYHDEYDGEEFMGPMERTPTFFLFKIAALYCKNITNLELCRLDCSNDKSKGFEAFEDETEKDYLELLFLNNNIRTLSLKGSTINGKSLLKLKPNLIEELDISGCSFTVVKYYYKFLEQLTNLNKFKASLISFEEIRALRNSENIYEFSITGCKSVDEISKTECIDELSEFLSKQKKLSKLYLGSIVVDEIFSNKLPKSHLQKLEILIHENFLCNEIHQFDNLRVLECKITKLKNDIIKNLTKCKCLEELDISIRDYGLTKAGEVSFENFKNLKALHFVYTNEKEPLVDNIIIALSKCKKLSNLKMEGFQISDVGVNCINNEMPNLKFFFASMTDRVLGKNKVQKKLIRCSKKFPVVNTSFEEVPNTFYVEKRRELQYGDYGQYGPFPRARNFQWWI